MPRIKQSSKLKVEGMVKCIKISSELSAQHSAEAQRYADLAKKTLAKIYIVLNEKYPLQKK